MLPEDCQPKEVPEEKVEEFALRAFFYDYCVVSTNHSLSRGYLDGLELMLHHLGFQSDLAKACKVVAFADHGIKLRRPVLTRKAELLYHELLGSLARAIENPAFAHTAEPLMIAMLLGLYEMIMASDAHPSSHNAHARGVAAILQIENSPLDLFGAVQFIRSGHSLVLNGVVQNCGMFSAPQSSNLVQCLDSLLLTFGPFWGKADALLATPLIGSHDLYLLKEEAIALDRDFAKWQEAQVKGFKPRTVGHVSQGPAGSNLGVGYWPGRVDTYFDLYVAGVWNTSRTARILLISLTLKLSKILNDNQDHAREHQDALHLVEDIVASIPYHLTEDPHAFLRDLGQHAAAMKPGKSVGGLLLMHPIYVASKLLIVPRRMREYMTECLAWIGMYMGLGQASLFAKTPQIHEQYLADGCTLVWAGILV
ncbi:MAG: hypothetical protein M1818_007103 [Claussenomyces sp. TS43310]|nr:MAG: hypothetical protein M1818_007103 [Claussenomyces sp. TS43310]